jgi:hypothetical protein
MSELHKVWDTLNNFPYGASLAQLEAIARIGESATQAAVSRLIDVGLARFDGKLYFPIEEI